MKDHHYDSSRTLLCCDPSTFATFVNTIGMVWGIPYTNEIRATDHCVGVLIGAGLLLSAPITIPSVDLRSEPGEDDFEEVTRISLQNLRASRMAIRLP